MRIVHVSDCYLPRLGGIERQVRDLAVAQQQQGHEVRVITSTIGPAPQSDDEIQVCRPQPRITSHPGDMRYGWSRRGRRLVLSGKFDLVHIHASAFSPLAFLTAAAATSCALPTAVTVHSLWAYASPLFRASQRLTGWGQWPVAWSAVSPIAAEPLQRIVTLAKPVAILPNGVDAAWWKISPRPRHPGRVVVATVGRLAPRKRPQPLLNMLRQVRARLPGEIQLEMVLIGEGPQRGSLQRFIARHAMSSWVQLPGPADHEQIRTVFAGVDFYVAPARLESFGIAALEARCAGLPVIAYAASGIAEFIRHDVEGLLVSDDDDMVASILRLAMSPPTLERMRRHNTGSPPTITWPGVMSQCDALYEQARAIAAAATGRRSQEILGR